MGVLYLFTLVKDKSVTAIVRDMERVMHDTANASFMFSLFLIRQNFAL